MVTLYITDLDGTLLDNEAALSPETARKISELSRMGAIISVATARTPATVEPILGPAETFPRLVVMTGAAIWDRVSGRFRDMHLLPRRDVDAMLDVFDRRGIHPFCYVLSPDGGRLEVYHGARELSPEEKIFVGERNNLSLKDFRLGQRCPATDRDRVALFFGMGAKDDIVSVAAELGRVSDCYISYYKDTYTPDLWLLEIFAPGVSKAAGVARLKERIGADRVVAFGDNLNDIPMLEEADLGVAVGNALDDVKAIADVVIGPNTENSVARFIEEDFRRNAGA